MKRSNIVGSVRQHDGTDISSETHLVRFIPFILLK